MVLLEFLHIYLLLKIFLEEKKGYSFASFGLWSALDFIAAWNIHLEGGDHTLALVWGCCAGLMALLLLIKKQASWSRTENLVLFLIIVCLVIQNIYGPSIALIAAVTSLVIASVPQIKDSYITPNRKVGRVYIIFTLSAVVSLFAAKELTFASLSYPVTASLMCGTIMFFSYAKKNQSIKIL